jgi:Flp pilus assembly protein TadD
LLATGDCTEAAECSRAVLATEPHNLGALVNLGSALQGLRRFAEAGEAYRQALVMAPDHPAIHFNLGTLHQSEGYFSQGEARHKAFTEAKRAYEAAVASEQMQPGDARHIDTLLCLASLAMADLHLDEALARLDQALALQPENPDARTRRGQLALLMGDFAAGWRDYEYRFAQSGNKRLPPFAQPLWRNDFPLAGKTILLMAEQGMGDAIHFVRYVEQVAQQAPAAILIEAHDALRPLLATLAVPVTVLETGQPFPPFDCYCPLMSLPFAFGTRIDTIPARVPYLAADAQRSAHWAARLGEQASPGIGIVWSGSTALNNDFHRSIALEHFAGLLPPALRAYSLQKDVRDSDVPSLRKLPDIVHFGAELRDYADTAALIANLDLVITVDTSVAHLAGAMGKSVWILLPFLPDYRWLTGRDDSPWYPTARLFRQTEAGDWGAVFAQVRQALDNRYSSNRAAP